MKEKILIVCAAVFVSFFVGCSVLTPASKIEVKSIYPGDTQMWEHIFKSADMGMTGVPDYNFKSAPFGVILPHHMVVGYELARFYQKMSKLEQPSVVVVISPNHYQKGDSNIQTCANCEYQTTDGALSLHVPEAVEAAQEGIVGQLLKDGVAVDGGQNFVNEHGLYNHAPFIKHYFPKAKFVPIMLKWETTPEQTKALADWLNSHLPADALVIASVDFSHYMPVDMADFHDISSYATIHNFDYENIYDLEIDSPPSISTVMHLMENRGYQDVQRLAHTNNQDFRTGIVDRTTSHNFIAFYKGQKNLQAATTILDLSGLKNLNGLAKITSLGNFEGWQWDITGKKQEPEAAKFLQYLRGEEDRFLVGSDKILFTTDSQKDYGLDLGRFKDQFGKFVTDALKKGSIVAIATDRQKIMVRVFPVEIKSGYPVLQQPVAITRVFKTGECGDEKLCLAI